MLIVGGAFQVLQSIAALVNDEYILVLRNYILSLDLTVWGSIHLIVGLILAAIGVCLLLGQGLGQNRRHRGGRHLSRDQLLLAALLTRVGHPGHRSQRPRHLGAGHGRSPRVGGASATTVLGSSQGLIYGRPAMGGSRCR